MQTRCCFERNEKKYMLSLGQYERLMGCIAPYLKPDKYGVYTICSLYFDTPCLASWRAHQDKPVFREKLRLRSYGVPQGGDTVFLELKKKLDGVTYKRRLPLTHDEARAYLRFDAHSALQGQIFEEIDWYLKRNGPEPRFLLCYDRQAWAGIDDESLRLTFDTGIRWRTDKLCLSFGDGGTPLLHRDMVLMEVKTAGPQPLWLARALSREGVWPTSFSKYSNAVEAALRGEEKRDVG